jgi:hypothetical protein
MSTSPKKPRTPKQLERQIARAMRPRVVPSKVYERPGWFYHAPVSRRWQMYTGLEWIYIDRLKLNMVDTQETRVPGALWFDPEVVRWWVCDGEAWHLVPQRNDPEFRVMRAREREAVAANRAWDQMVKADVAERRRIDAEEQLRQQRGWGEVTPKIHGVLITLLRRAWLVKR